MKQLKYILRLYSRGPELNFSMEASFPRVPQQMPGLQDHFIQHCSKVIIYNAPPILSIYSMQLRKHL